MRLSLLAEALGGSKIRAIATKLNLPTEDDYMDQLLRGIKVEQEHNSGNLDVVKTLEDLVKIAAAHLKEIPDYYTKLKKMEDSA